MNDLLLEPCNAYKTSFAGGFKTNAEQYFDDLVRKSGINVEQNRKTVSDFNEATLSANASRKKLGQLTFLRGFLIVVAVAAFIVAIVGIVGFVTGSSLLGNILMLVLGLLGGAGMILIIVLVLKPKIHANREELNKLNSKADGLQKRAWEEMAPLNRLFESDATRKLIEKTVPTIKIDPYFDMRRFDYLSGKYGLNDNEDQNSSTIGVLTGEILGNPFVVDRELVRRMGMQRYTGSLTISWQTSYTDSEGNSHVENHTQTLTASVDKPKPFYSEQTRLIYGNEAAPDLTFTHSPSHAEKLSEKELEKTVKSGEKSIQKLQAKALKDGGNFTEMGNSEFDVLFGALDRNNEVQFRLMFTPLAQKNMLTLMKSNTGYGDDFQFVKRGCLNYISSEHSAQWDMDTYYKRHYGYDIDECKSRFLAFNQDYFKSLFFDLAPLLSVPLYQQHKPKEYIYKTLYNRNYTSYESEFLVNRLDECVLKNPESGTRAILKTAHLGKEDKTDVLNVTAHSFRVEDRVDYVTKMGGDGYLHDVPVYWQEYIPVQSDSVVRVKELPVSDKQFEENMKDGKFAETIQGFASGTFLHGLLCCVTAEDDTSFDAKINGLLNLNNK